MNPCRECRDDDYPFMCHLKERCDCECHDIIFSRAWAMPSKDTFTIKPIAKLLDKYVGRGVKSFADPFAGYNSRAEYTNDLDPNTPTQWHMEALDFCNMLGQKYGLELDGVLFDPPYSNRQISEHYKALGRKATQEDTSAKFFSKVKDALAPMVRQGGYAISFGWNSQGFGIKRGFKIVEILLVAHGGAHNDTIVVVERKVSTEVLEVEALRTPPTPKGAGIRAGDLL